MAAILGAILYDLPRNKRSGRVADMIEELCGKFPTLKIHVKAMIQQSTETLLGQLAGMGHDLTGFAHANDYLDDLKDDLEEFINPPPAEEEPGEPDTTEKLG
jgi:hypothetical protein